jgi:hypothetical protein
MKITTFLYTVPYSLVESDRRFRGAYYPQQRGSSPSWEAVSTSETSVSLHETTRRSITETERHGRVVGTPASYSRGCAFKFWIGDRLSRGVSWFSSVSAEKYLNGAFKLGHDCFLPNPFQFIIHFAISIDAM